LIFSRRLRTIRCAGRRVLYSISPFEAHKSTMGASERYASKREQIYPFLFARKLSYRHFSVRSKDTSLFSDVTQKFQDIISSSEEPKYEVWNDGNEIELPAEVWVAIFNFQSTSWLARYDLSDQDTIFEHFHINFEKLRRKIQELKTFGTFARSASFLPCILLTDIFISFQNVYDLPKVAHPRLDVCDRFGNVAHFQSAVIRSHD
jgi:hypothetical protein